MRAGAAMPKGVSHFWAEDFAVNGTMIANFSHAAQQAQQWVNELAEDLDWQEERAYRC
jgi:hypothetical protein